MPSSSIAGSTHQPSVSGKRIGRIDPAIAPAMNWPSAPMFQTLER
jgi:hypothetical protein